MISSDTTPTESDILFLDISQRVKKMKMEWLMDEPSTYEDYFNDDDP